MGTLPRPFIYILSVAVFASQKQSWVAGGDLVACTNIFILVYLFVHNFHTEYFIIFTVIIKLCVGKY